MKSRPLLFAEVIGVLTFLVVRQRLTTFIGRDTCLDAGGRWVAALGQCEGVRGELAIGIVAVVLILLVGITVGACAGYAVYVLVDIVLTRLHLQARSEPAPQVYWDEQERVASAVAKAFPWLFIIPAACMVAVGLVTWRLELIAASIAILVVGVATVALWTLAVGPVMLGFIAIVSFARWLRGIVVRRRAV